MAPSIMTNTKGARQVANSSDGVSRKINLPPPRTSQTIPTTTGTLVSSSTTAAATISGLSTTNLNIDTSPTTTDFPSTATLSLQFTSFPIPISPTTNVPISLPSSVLTSSQLSQTVTEALDVTGDASGVPSTVLSSALPTVPPSTGSEGIPTATSTGRLITGPSMNRIIPIAVTVPILLISTVVLALYFLRRRRRMRATLLPQMTFPSREDDDDDWNWKHSSGEFHPITPFDASKNTEKVNGATTGTTTTKCAKTRPPISTPNTDVRSSVHKIPNSVSRRPGSLAPKEVRQKLPNIPEPLPDISNDVIATQIHNSPDVVPQDSGQQHAPTISRTRTFLMEQVEVLQERLRFMEDNVPGYGEQNTRGDHGSLDGELRELIPPPRYTTII